ncbi:MAG: hypothetical protein CME59_12670 [Halioglobus sp.]|nr:hypothetical protein [Halioglobus sp.]
MKRGRLLLACLALSTLCATAPVAARDYSEQRQPCRDADPLRQPFFGDLHVHTRYSLDASTQGTRTTPDQAYQFARGEKLGIQPWLENGKSLRSLQLDRPLDFAMVSDHAELIGEVHMCNTPEVQGYDSWQCLLYRHWPRGAFYLFNFMSSMRATHMGQCGEDDALCLQAARVPWGEMLQAAEQHYDRSADCDFTSFVGYEWTGLRAEGGGNLHRNVVFRNAEVPELPVSFIDAPAPERLWSALDQRCIDAQGACDALVIPHNSNMSAGAMFDGLGDGGAAMSADYASRRSRMEPVVEIMQHKGASECYYEAGVSVDELCAFEQLPIDNIAGYGNPPRPDTGFVREVLGRGLALQAELGADPYRFGFIASTDTHLGTPGAAQEGDFLGHGGAGEPSRDAVPPGLPDKLEYNPGGLAVVWAEENSRDALFDALRRRETYGTSGPRITSRFFAGWDYPEDLCFRPDRIERAYAGGVPMGGELNGADGDAPRFLVLASQDPGSQAWPGMPLQRLQVIKGRLDDQGRYREQVIDVAGDPHNGATVDTRSCQPRGEGFAQLCAVWSDKDFDPQERAWYYARVVENPSCRWSQRICIANGVDCSRPETIGDGLEGCCAAEHRPVLQERAWTSPIWYNPAP